MFAVLILQLDLIELDRIGKQAKMQTDDNLRIAILCVFFLRKITNHISQMQMQFKQRKKQHIHI